MLESRLEERQLLFEGLFYLLDHGDELLLGMYAELLVDVARVHLDRSFRNEESLGDGMPVSSAHKLFGNFRLTLCKRMLACQLLAALRKRKPDRLLAIVDCDHAPSCLRVACVHQPDGRNEHEHEHECNKRRGSMSGIPTDPNSW